MTTRFRQLSNRGERGSGGVVLATEADQKTRRATLENDRLVRDSTTFLDHAPSQIDRGSGRHNDTRPTKIEPNIYPKSALSRSASQLADREMQLGYEIDSMPALRGPTPGTVMGPAPDQPQVAEPEPDHRTPKARRIEIGAPEVGFEMNLWDTDPDLFRQHARALFLRRTGLVAIPWAPAWATTREDLDRAIRARRTTIVDPAPLSRSSTSSVGARLEPGMKPITPLLEHRPGPALERQPSSGVHDARAGSPIPSRINRRI